MIARNASAIAGSFARNKREARLRPPPDPPYDLVTDLLTVLNVLIPAANPGSR